MYRRDLLFAILVLLSGVINAQYLTVAPTPPENYIPNGPSDKYVTNSFIRGDVGKIQVKDDNGGKCRLFFGYYLSKDGDKGQYLGIMIPSKYRGCIEKGDKVKIRLSNGAVYEGEAMYDVKSKMYQNNFAYLSDGGDDGVGGFTFHDAKNWTPIAARYKISNEAKDEIKKWGIVKLRYYANGEIIDHQFSGKNAKELFEKMYWLIPAISIEEYFDEEIKKFSSPEPEF